MLQDRLKIFAKHIGSAAKLAEKIDMSPQQLTQYTNGKSKPGADILLKLCELGCNINWLLTGRGEMLLGEETQETKETTKDIKITNDNNSELTEIKAELEKIRKDVIELKKHNNNKTNTSLNTIEINKKRNFSHG